MAIDYSKWDKLELSDDSDIECHPNVDKKSFIRWKQQDIHQKRIERNQNIKNLEFQIPMYEELNKRTNQLMKQFTDDQLSENRLVKQYLADKFENTYPKGIEEVNGGDPSNQATFNEMIEDLFETELKGLKGAALRTKLQAHVNTIDNSIKDLKKKLETLYEERSLHISSEDIHTGWDRSFLNKSAPSEIPTPSSSTIQKSTLETKPASSSNSASKASAASTSLSSTGSSSKDVMTVADKGAATTEEIEDDAEGDNEKIDDVLPETLKFSNIPMDRITTTRTLSDFLSDHKNANVVSQGQKDALLMSAFNTQLDESKSASEKQHRVKEIIRHTTLLQFILDVVVYEKTNTPESKARISKTMLNRLFEASSTNNPLLMKFYEEVENIYNHIKKRCEIIAAGTPATADEEEGVEVIELRSVDENSKLSVNLPDEESTDAGEVERVKAFSLIPEAMQRAFKTESLDEVNKVFRSMKIEEAEKVLEMINEAGLISVDLVEKEEYENIKQQYKEGEELEREAEGGDEKITAPVTIPVPNFVSSIDEID